MNTKEIVDALKKGVVTVVFEKIDTGETRIMPCTLNNDISETEKNVTVKDGSTPLVFGDNYDLTGIDINQELG